MPRVRAIIVENGALALIKRQRDGRTYYVFPGGGVEAGESFHQAVSREVMEELGVTIEIIRQIARVDYRSDAQYFYLCRRLSGEFGSGRGPEFSQYPPERGTYTPIWMPIPEMPCCTVVPIPIANLVRKSVKTRWPNQPVWIDLTVS